MERSTSVLTKKPISRSTSGRSRPEVTVPTAMSRPPDSRASRIWDAATSVMNRVVPRLCPNSLRRRLTSAGTVNSTVAPCFVRTAGRGRSVGSSSGGTPANWRVQ
ncbi:hypothetical protein SANTM175S_04200 [Streptomyces antimycoticus]